MRLISRSLTLVGAAIALATTTLVPASSASAEENQPKEWGMVTIEIDPSSSQMTPMVVKEAGGGTWSYGTALASNGQKICYSNYVHSTKDHSSTAKIAGGSDKDYADAGYWSEAETQAGQAYTCYAYWSTS